MAENRKPSSITEHEVALTDSCVCCFIKSDIDLHQC